MIARLVVAQGLDGAAHARWAAATLLDVTACAWRDDARGEDDAGAGGAPGPVVFVGAATAAPRGRPRASRWRRSTA